MGTSRSFAFLRKERFIKTKCDSASFDIGDLWGLEKRIGFLKALGFSLG